MWKQGAKTYLGTMSVGFPNLFLVTGPQSPSVLSNVIVSLEQHVEWITGAIEYLEKNKFTRMEASRTAQEDWVAANNFLGEVTVHRNSGSWYVGANVEGKARVVLPALMGVGPFRAACTEVARDNYKGFILAS